MASNLDDFDDFFDTGSPKAESSSKVEQSKRKSSVSSERRVSTDYSSDSTSLDDDSGRQKNKSRSCSDSPRGRDSYFTDDSRSRSPPGRSGNRRRQSRSPSSGKDSSRSRTASSSDSVTAGRENDKNVRVSVKVKVPSGVREGSSLSAESEKDKSNKHKSRNATRGQAWSTNDKKSRKNESDSSSSRKAGDRKPRKSERSSKVDMSDSDEASSTHEKITQQTRKKDRRDSFSHSDSDITDVSPISSSPPRKEHRNNKRESKPPKQSYARAPGMRDRENSSRSRDITAQKKTNLDLNLLMDAVSELEKKQSRVKANTRSVMFEPGGRGSSNRGDSGLIRRERKSNYTFSDSDTNRIDQENQRLMRQIMCRMNAVDSRYTGSAGGKGRKKTLSVPAASGINRMKDHHRIEMENLALLKRIQHIRPTKGISKQEQLSAYHTTLLHGVPISTMECPAPAPALDPPPDLQTGSRRLRSRPSSAKSASSQLGRTRSLLSLQSTGTATTSASSIKSGVSGRSGHSSQSLRSLRRRPSSAKSSLRERPPWDDRW